MFDKIKKWLNKNVSKNTVEDMFDQDKMKLISENLCVSHNIGHFRIEFNKNLLNCRSDKYKKFDYLAKIYIWDILPSELIYSNHVYTSGIWDDALKECLETLYQKALEKEKEKINFQNERKQKIENLFKKEV